MLGQHVWGTELGVIGSMSQGGGFCDKHGPYDPPHTICPYCAREYGQRRAYEPPDDNPPSPAGDSDEAADLAFVRATVESGPDLTEVAPRETADEVPTTDDYGPPAPLAWLVIKRPLAQRGTIITLRGHEIIGREGDIQWDDPRLSRQHARLTLEPPADDPDSPPLFYLWPFGTTNPVIINGQEIRGATPLAENDEIHLGDTLFVFKVLLD
jgi:hypothetical protein